MPGEKIRIFALFSLLALDKIMKIERLYYEQMKQINMYHLLHYLLWVMDSGFLDVVLKTAPVSYVEFTVVRKKEFATTRKISSCCSRSSNGGS